MLLVGLSTIDKCVDNRDVNYSDLYCEYSQRFLMERLVYVSLMCVCVCVVAVIIFWMHSERPGSRDADARGDISVICQ